MFRLLLLVASSAAVAFAAPGARGGTRRQVFLDVQQEHEDDMAEQADLAQQNDPRQKKKARGGNHAGCHAALLYALRPKPLLGQGGGIVTWGGETA